MELDEAYANAAFIDGADRFPDQWSENAAAFRKSVPNHKVISYGAHERQKIDLFLPQEPPKGVMIFVHGGYWLNFDRTSWSHLGAGALGHGFAAALPSYVLAPEARISEITRAIAKAVVKIADEVEGRLFLTGHSAGGHLVARMLEAGLLRDDVAQRIAKVVPISPVGDLRPLLRTSMRDGLGLNEEEAKAESPVLITKRLDVPVTVWVGQDERPVFLEQARGLAQAWDAKLHIEPAKHHFDVIDGLADPAHQLTQAVLGLDAG